INPPRDLSVQVQSGKVVLVDWNPPIQGRYNQFKITIEPLSQQDDSGIRTVMIGLHETTPVTIHDLTPGASYEIRLHSVFRKEESREFLRTNFTTIPSPLPEPKIWFRNETSLLVKLANPLESIFDHYRIEIIPNDSYESVRLLPRPETGHRPSVAFHGLRHGKSYNISVQTQSLDKWSEPVIATFSTIPRLPIDDDGDFNDYSSQISSFSSMASHSAPIFTNGGPPGSLTVQDGRDAEIQCEATGLPFPAVEWWFYSFAEQNKRQLNLESKQKYASNAHGALIITQVEKSDEGEYTCYRINNLGSINGTTKLNVILRTQIDQPPVDSKVILSSTAELQCRVRHDPGVSIKIYWTFNKRNLSSIHSSRIKINQDGTLRIEQVRNTDVGLYTCRVESDGGNDKRSARLDVIELPHPPTNVVSELNLNSDAVNVSWTPPFDGNSPIIKYIVQMRTVSNNRHNQDVHPNYGTENNPSLSMGGSQPSNDDELVYGVNTWTTASINISATQNFVLISNLRPAITYQFRVSAINSVGEGQPSMPTNPPITLPAQPPNASPLGVVGAPRSSTAITIQWQPPPTESHNGQLSGYIVRYKLAGYAEHTPWYTYNVTNSAQMSCLLEDLIVWQNYQIQVAAYNEMGIGAYSSSIFVRTKEGPPASPVRSLEAEAINSTAIRVVWMPPDPQLINGINQGYKIQAWFSKNSTRKTADTDYETNTLFSVAVLEQPAKEMIVPPSPFQQDGLQHAIINGLEPYTNYDITVLCFTSAGDGPRYDPPPLVTTKQDLPSEVAFLKFRDILDKSVRVIWSLPKKINGKLIAYTLRYFIVNSEKSSTIIKNLTALDNETIITNLMPQTAYTFQINAWTEVGAGPITSSTIQSSVPPVLPVSPTHLAISNIQPFSAVLQFTPGFNGNASITKWIVEAQPFKLRNPNWSVIYESTNHTQDDAITVYNLRPYTEYRLRLIPVNVVGKARYPSESSPPFQTLQARVRWTPLPPESWHGHPRGYNITWIQSDNSENPIGNSPLFSHILSDYHSHSYLITSLNEFTNYRIQVFAINDLGTSTGSHFIYQRTNEATPDSGPKNVDVRGTSSTTIVVEWNEISEVDRNGIIQGFKVRYAALKNGASTVDTSQYKLIESNSSRTTTLTELKKFTKYQISVCGFTHVGDGVYSVPVTAETFQDVPGPPSNVTFPDVTLTTARIKWDIPEEPNGEILAYKISYRLSEEQNHKNDRNNLNKRITREFQSTDRTYRFLDLLPESYYLFEVTARTIEGWGQPAKALVYMTNTRELPFPPSQPLISVSQISSRQVTISWTPGRDGFAPLRYYTVQISTQGGHWWTYPSKIDPILRVYTVVDLRPFTTYQFRLKATNDIGDSAWSSESPITRTLPAPPDSSPQNVMISPFTPSSISVRWIPVTDWNGDDIGAGYRVQYCLITQQGVSSSCPSSLVRGKNQTQAIIENLERDQHYEIRVIAFNSQGDGPSTKPKVVYVGEAVPTGEPLEISAEPLSSTEIKVTWRPPDQSKQNGQIMGYKIFYWIQSAAQSSLFANAHSVSDLTQNDVAKSNPKEMMEIVPDTLESFILLDLLKWTNYSIQVSAFNPAGDGPRSKPIVVRTKEDLPGEIGLLKFDEITMSQVKVSWKPPIEPNGLLLGYYITYETLIGDFSKQVKQKINDSYLMVNNLRERVLYTFKVRAENSIGLGPERTGNVTTGPQPGSPQAPFEVILQQTLTSVRLKWKNPDYREPLLGYLIEANNLNKKSSLEWQPIIALRNGRQDRYELSFTQLSPSSQYQFRVMSFNRFGVSEPAYPNKLYGGASIISTPSHLELRARMPYYRETWFVVLCACLSVIITVMVIAVLCVRNKTYKYRKEAMKNNGSTGSQDHLSELGFGIDDMFENPIGAQTLELEMRGLSNPGNNNGSTIGLIMANNNSLVNNNRNNRNRLTIQRKNKENQNQNILNTAAIAAQARQPPRPCPGSFSYSDEDDLDDCDDVDDDLDDRDDVKPPPGLYEISSGNESLTEKPSELSSTGPDSDSEDHDDLVAANMFVNHYANVNDTLKKGLSWKKQAKPYIVPT
ncbi:sidekick-like protein, partial [Sarcoptes scabiei]